METMAGAWGVHAVGVAGLEVAPSARRQGLATYLLGEAFRQLHAQGVALVEVHVAEENAAGPGAVRASWASIRSTARCFYRKD